jgi:hypothetical protein
MVKETRVPLVKTVGAVMFTTAPVVVYSVTQPTPGATDAVMVAAVPEMAWKKHAPVPKTPLPETLTGLKGSPKMEFVEPVPSVFT